MPAETPIKTGEYFPVQSGPKKVGPHWEGIASAHTIRGRESGVIIVCPDEAALTHVLTEGLPPQQFESALFRAVIIAPKP